MIITEQKHSEKILREKEVLLREQQELVEQTYDAIYSWDINDGIIYWNRNAENFTVIQPKKFRGERLIRF